MHLTFVIVLKICIAFNRIVLADASSIAIRKHATQRSSSSLSGKLAIGIAGQYETANGLIKSLKDPSKVCTEFKKYVANGGQFHQVCWFHLLINLYNTLSIPYWGLHSYCRKWCPIHYHHQNETCALPRESLTYRMNHFYLRHLARNSWPKMPVNTSKQTY